MRAFAGGLGMNAETLRQWIRQDEVDHGDREGTTTVAALENREHAQRSEHERR